MGPVRRYALVLVAGLAVAGCLTTPRCAAAARPENSLAVGADAGSKIAFMLVFSGRLHGVVPVSVSGFREAVSKQLSTTLSEQGFEVIKQEAVLSLMREWRVRDDVSIPRGFLDSIAQRLDARLLLVANLVIQPGRLIMTARYLDPASAVLLKVIVAEWVIERIHDDTSGENGTEWLAGARETGKLIGDANLEKRRSPKSPALMLNIQPVGCPETVTLIARHVLLEYFVEHGDWDMIDPAVVNAVLQEAGYSGKYLGSEARALLRKTFACSRLMVPGLISYDPAPRTARQVDEFDDVNGRGEPTISDFVMNLRLVDLASGSVIAGKEVFMAAPEGTGWFGIPRKDTLMTRLKITAGRLWFGMRGALEES